MKIILLRDKGVHLAVQLSRKRMAVMASAALVCVAAAGIWVAMQLPTDRADAQVVAQWRAKLSAQRDLVVEIERAFGNLDRCF